MNIGQTHSDAWIERRLLLVPKIFHFIPFLSHQSVAYHSLQREGGELMDEKVLG